MLSNFRIPLWVWATATIINLILFIYNWEAGNDRYMSLNVLCATTCIIGALNNRPR